jgi:predicted esterase
LEQLFETRMPANGASYALSVGITNGDLFGHVIAFSPGFMAPAGQTVSPRVFVSHGTRDAVALEAVRDPPFRH